MHVQMRMDSGKKSLRSLLETAMNAVHQRMILAECGCSNSDFIAQGRGRLRVGGAESDFAVVQAGPSKVFMNFRKWVGIGVQRGM
jgi:hypothetical protein